LWASGLAGGDAGPCGRVTVINSITRVEVRAVDRSPVDALPGGRNTILLSVAKIVVAAWHRGAGGTITRYEVTGLHAVAGVSVITDDGCVDALTGALITAVCCAGVVVVAGFGQVGAISSRVTRILRARIVVVAGRDRRLIEAGPGVFVAAVYGALNVVIAGLLYILTDILLGVLDADVWCSWDWEIFNARAVTEIADVIGARDPVVALFDPHGDQIVLAPVLWIARVYRAQDLVVADDGGVDAADERLTGVLGADVVVVAVVLLIDTAALLFDAGDDLAPIWREADLLFVGTVVCASRWVPGSLPERATVQLTLILGARQAVITDGVVVLFEDVLTLTCL